MANAKKFEMVDDLLHCPFCGSDEVGPSYQKTIDETFVMIRCNWCGSQGPIISYDCGNGDNVACISWNRRKTFKS